MREARKICVIGTGYVGLVTGACFADLDNRVTCVDTDAGRIASLRAGKLPFYEPSLAELVERNSVSGRLAVSTSYEDGVAGASFIFLCLPTPPGPNGAADTSILRSAIRRLAEVIYEPYPIIVNKSTAPVGTCEALRELLADEDPALESVPVVSNPEFLREGSAIRDFMRPDRVVVGADVDEAARVKDLYEPLGVPMLLADTRTSEMIKYASNAFLAAKISFINEVANICERMDADSSLVAEGMGLDRRIGGSFLRPGVGYGGSCFPKDVLALSHMASENGVEPRLLEAVMEVNASQVERVMQKLWDHLGYLEGAVVAVWGIAFKPDTDDIREAPAMKMIDSLEREGVAVRAYDPAAMKKAAVQLPRTAMCQNPYEATEGADAVLLLTEWDEFGTLDLARVAATMNIPMLLDGRNAIAPSRAREAGFHYVGVGRGETLVYHLRIPGERRPGSANSPSREGSDA
ncbi:MAG TPA: UDP-glucose/GDP-mannose dehydrogenase family protein [Rubrobacter sp.]|nr:UDP-glucose/GDP-mannose dehydrogenase family protein [Rubrobacter sp.]